MIRSWWYKPSLGSQVFVALVLLSIAFAAFAQSGTVAPATFSWGYVINIVITSLVIPLIVQGFGLIRSWAQKTANDRDKSGFDLWSARLINALDPLGADIWKELTPEIKKAIALDSPGGIAISDDERKHLTEASYTVLLRFLGEGGLKAAYRSMGFPDPMGLVTWLLSKLIPRIQSGHDANDYTVSTKIATTLYPIPDLNDVPPSTLSGTGGSPDETPAGG
jgi:hypothetical protein